jgi:hypothetical protein
VQRQIHVVKCWILKKHRKSRLRARTSDQRDIPTEEFSSWRDVLDRSGLMGAPKRAKALRGPRTTARRRCSKTPYAG